MFDLTAEENWFSAEDIKDIPDIISDVEQLKQEIEEFTAWLKLKRHSDLMRAAVAA